MIVPELKLYRDIVDVLLAEHERSIPPEGAADDVSAKLLGCVWGLYCQIHRHARAALLLHDNEMAHESGIMARVMMEHTVVMHWIVERKDKGAEALLASQAKSMKNWVNRTSEKSSLMIPPEIAAELKKGFEGIDEKKTLGKFIDICDELGSQDLYAVYGFLSNFVHPTLTTSNMYCDQAGNLRITLPDLGENNVSLITHCLIWAERDFDSLTPGNPRAEGLEKLASTIQARPVLPKYRAIPPKAKKKDSPRNSGNRKQA